MARNKVTVIGAGNVGATTAQRSGHGRWLRTIMRGALIDRRRRSNFRRMDDVLVQEARL